MERGSERESIISKVEGYTMESGRMTYKMGMESRSSLVGRSMKVSGRME
jgi:hypothetical protein